MFFKRSKPQPDLKKQIADSGLFLREWYLKTYPDVAIAGMDPLEHYLKYGDKEGRLPNRYFEPNRYREQAAAARKTGVNALLHYATKGWKQGKETSPFFSGRLYLKQYPDAETAAIAPLQHFLTLGQYQGKLLFPRALENHVDSDKLIKDMVTIHASGLFDAEWYKKFYTDLWQANMEPLFHFVMHGAKENRQPNPIFQTSWYREQNSERVGDKNPLMHYINAHPKQKYDPAPDFSNKVYFKSHPELNSETDDPLAHYLVHGLPAGQSKPTKETLAKGPAGKVRASAKLPVHAGLRGMIDYEQQPLSPLSSEFNSACMNIHWIIPDFAAGGGGHMTIFRMVSYLERAGHQQTIWINDPTLHKSEKSAADDILKYFQQFTGAVKFLDRRFKKAQGDAVIATDCWTVWPALSAANFQRRFYFVQDFEPSFHPMGANYLAAEETYRQDIDCICASPWLAQRMETKYGRWARPFWLAADTELYHPPKKKRVNKTPRIAFYARHFTARRAVELGMLALEVLAKRGMKFEVDFFGAPLEFQSAPFRFRDHAVASPEELANLFQQADIGVVFSATNYSLVPQEMMACGLPIVELKGESTDCIFPADTVSLAEPHPNHIAEAMAALLEDKALREKQAKQALHWVQSFSWKASAELVEIALKERLAEFAKDTASQKKAVQKSAKPKASVVIPTLNAGPILDRVLAAVTTQEVPWAYEILVIDSGSTDGTLDTVARYPDVRLHQIDKQDFNHGGTRNLGVELTKGDYIAFLTHDALPANPRWLYNLVTSLERHPKAAGAFGKHLPYPEASAFTQRDLNAHFEQFNHHPICVDKNTNKRRFEKGDVGWRQFLHYYSDNNSILRRKVWEKIPYRPVKFGEDQVWANDIIEAGYGKVYAVRAVVYHSHDFEPAETQDRCKTEAAFFKHFFGYELVKNEADLSKHIEVANYHDEKWAEANGLTKKEVQERFAQNKARLHGYLDGALADTEGMF